MLVTKAIHVKTVVHAEHYPVVDTIVIVPINTMEEIAKEVFHFESMKIFFPLVFF